jgi:predicted lipoprotein with Yx(FWY)xxD motif
MGSIRTAAARSMATRSRGSRRFIVGGALAAVLFVSAACSSGGSSSSTTGGGASTQGTYGAAVVALAPRGSLGTVLVDHTGATLYRYTPDGTGKSVCTGSCASTWPPVTVPAGTTHVAASTGISAGELGTITRSDGSLQVTFKGMPLYRYSGDANPGDASGQGLNGIWFVVPVTKSATSVTTTTKSAGGYGY